MGIDVQCDIGYGVALKQNAIADLTGKWDLYEATDALWKLLQENVDTESLELLSLTFSRGEEAEADVLLGFKRFDVTVDWDYGLMRMNLVDSQTLTSEERAAMDAALAVLEENDVTASSHYEWRAVAYMW